MALAQLDVYRYQMADQICRVMTPEEEREVRRERASVLKRALDADAHPGVLSGLHTVLLFAMANDVTPRDCSSAPVAAVCR